MAAHDPQPGRQSAAPAHIKNETIKIPLPQSSGGGKLPPVPPRVALAASAEDPESHRRSMPPTPRFPSAETVKIPALPPLEAKIRPVPRPVTAQKTVPAPAREPVSEQKGWGNLDGWLGVAATGVGTMAISFSLYAAEILGHAPHAATWAANAIAVVGTVAATGLSAKLLGLWPKSAARSQ